MKILNSMKLIQTTDYLLLIDGEAEIKEFFKGYVYQPHWKKPVKLEDSSISLNYAEEDRKEYGGGKIIAYRKLNEEAKELDLPELPPFEVNIEKLAKDRYGKYEASIDIPNKYLREGFIDGYKAAQSDKQYSLEDMYSFARFCNDNHSLDDSTGQYDWQPIFREYKPKTNKEMFNDWIQSLSTQQLPKEFIVTYERVRNWDSRDINGDYNSKLQLKTIINPEGKEELVGTYKY